jgi:glucosamine kinase
LKIILVESGSTKADWVILDNDIAPLFITTAGINPSTHPTLLDLKEFPELKLHIANSQEIHFYGAGVISDVTKVKVADWILLTKTKANIHVESDTLAAARACFGHNEGILGILGTGSNACYYNGRAIVSSVPSLGYILSDEGGGVHIGKEILKSYIYKTMPDNVQKIFESKYNDEVSRDKIIHNLYTANLGSAYLASFAPFLLDIDNAWKTNLITRCFNEYWELRILPLKKTYNSEIKIVGSIGYLHREILEQVAESHNNTISEIVQKPITALIDFHKQQ